MLCAIKYLYKLLYHLCCVRDEIVETLAKLRRWISYICSSRFNKRRDIKSAPSYMACFCCTGRTLVVGFMSLSVQFEERMRKGSKLVPLFNITSNPLALAHCITWTVQNTTRDNKKTKRKCVTVQWTFFIMPPTKLCVGNKFWTYVQPEIFCVQLLLHSLMDFVHTHTQ